MKSAVFSFLLLLIIKTAFLTGQTGYLAGTGKSGIEPDESLISLHLGGYGAPREGRFTLQWISKGNLPEAVTLAGMNDKLFIVYGNELLYSIPSETNIVWRSAGKATGIISIAGDDGLLYGLNRNGEILFSKSEGKARWKMKGTGPKGSVLIATSGGTLFATDGKGSLWFSPLTLKSSGWEKGEMPDNIISLSGNNGKLYALSSDGVIYSCEPGRADPKWLKIACKNNETIKEDIRFISFLNNRIYGISRDNNLYLGEHRSEGNLTARALAVKGGEQTVVILNVDICGLTGDFTGILKQEIREKHQLPAASIFINCSHTHFAPVAQNWLTWQEANQRPDSVYLYSVVRNGILNAVEKALSSMAPADLYFGRGTTDIGYNRSLKDHPELYDSDVDVLKIVYPEKKSESYLFLAACHPVFSTAGKLHYTISANYPGVARKLLEDRTGTSNSLFLQGTAGDINPKDNGEYISGEKLSNDVMAVLNQPMKKIEGPISFFLDTIDIPIKPWTMEEIQAFREQNTGKTGDVYAEKNVKWCDLMMDYYKKGTMPESLPEYIHTINIGNWKLVGFSRETTTGYGFGVKKLWPDKLVSVAGYTNDVSSYLPTHLHLAAKNYEGWDSFFWYGQANVFPMDADEIILGRISSLAH
jgi:hypothetical protein